MCRFLVSSSLMALIKASSSFSVSCRPPGDSEKNELTLLPPDRCF